MELKEAISHIFVFTSLSRFPFDWKTPYGYPVAVLIEGASGTCAIFCYVTVACFLIESCLLVISMLKDIANDLAGLHFIRSKNATVQFEHRFFSLFSSYSDVKQLSNTVLYIQHISDLYWLLLTPLEWLMNWTEFMNISSPLCFFPRSHRYAVHCWCSKMHLLSRNGWVFFFRAFFHFSSLFFHSQVGGHYQSNRNHKSTHSNAMVIRYDLFVLWIWRNVNESIQRIWWWIM